MNKKKYINRISKEARDFLEYIVLPASAIFAPWSIAFLWLKWLSRFKWIYREKCTSALKNAEKHTTINNKEEWQKNYRLTLLIDHADFYLSRTRSNRWIKKNLITKDKWINDKKPRFLMTFHWGAGLWALRHAKMNGLTPHMMLAPPNGPDFNERFFLKIYIKARMHEVQRILKNPIIFTPGALKKTKLILKNNEQVLVVMDVPPDQTKSNLSINIINIEMKMPDTLPQLAIDTNTPVTTYALSINTNNGKRELSINNIPHTSDKKELTANIFSHFDTIIKNDPAAWHLWTELPRFQEKNQS